MGKFFVLQGINNRVHPVSDSFHFNYGVASIIMDTDGEYTIKVNGSEYSEYVNSARRAPQYRPTVLKLSKELARSYDQQTFNFTQLNYNLSPARTRASVENTIDKLVLKKYKDKPFTLSKPTGSEIRQELEQEASQIYFRTFGRDSRSINGYVNANYQDALNQRINAWHELSKFHDTIQAQNAEKQNLIYYKEYSEKKEYLENILYGPSVFVDSEIRKKLSEIKLPFDLELDFSYSQQDKHLDVDVELSIPLPIPTQYASLLSSGKVSVKSKSANAVFGDFKICVFALTYYLANLFFDVSTNIETLAISVWDKGKDNGFIWVDFPRNDFINLVGSHRSFDPEFNLPVGKFFSPLYNSQSPTSRINTERSFFIKRVEEIKASFRL